MTDHRRIAVIPVHDEAPTLDRVLAQLDPLVEGLILVDDRVRNDLPVKINRSRPGTTVTDRFAVVAMSLCAFARVRAGRASAPERARAHLARAVIEAPP